MPCASPHFSPGAARASRAKRERARPAQSAIGTIIDIAVKLVKPKSFLTPTSGLVRAFLTRGRDDRGGFGPVYTRVCAC